MPSYDDLLAAIPAVARPDAAKARNLHVRVQNATNEMYEHSVEFKAMVRRLHFHHGIGTRTLAELVGVSRSRILVIVQKKK